MHKKRYKTDAHAYVLCIMHVHNAHSNMRMNCYVIGLTCVNSAAEFTDNCEFVFVYKTHSMERCYLSGSAKRKLEQAKAVKDAFLLQKIPTTVHYLKERERNTKQLTAKTAALVRQTVLLTT